MAHTPEVQTKAGCTQDHTSQETPGWSPSGRRWAVRAEEDRSPYKAVTTSTAGASLQHRVLVQAAPGAEPSGILGHISSAPPGSAQEPRSSPRPRKALQWRIILGSCWRAGSICVVSSGKSLEEGDVEAKAHRSPPVPRTLKSCSLFTTTGKTFGFSKWSVHT